MGDIALCSIENEDLLYSLFGINAELLIDHAWGYEPCEITHIKNYKPQGKSLGSGQVLHCAYDYKKTKLVVKEILEEPYSIHTFPGYKNLDVPFMTLENVINKDHPSWKNALSIKGIYLITDTKTGKKYVGKASGEKGFWQRWSDYI